jgi:uncharacterized membrane protein
MKLIWKISAVWAAAFAALDWWKWISYHADGDFALFIQTMASGFPSYHNAVENTNHFAIHFSPVYAVLSPVIQITHSVIPVFIVQGIAGALTGAGIYFLARRFMSERRALAVAAVAFLYPALSGLIFGDPFENVFAPAATVWLLYAFEVRKFVLFAVAGIAALCIKEDQALFLTVTGAYLAWRFRDDAPRRRAGSLLAAASVLTAVLYFGVLQPHLQPAGGWAARSFYDWAHATLDVAPWYSPVRLMYVLEVFVPLVFLPFRSPMLLLAVFPFLELLASPYSILFTNGTHYAGVWIGYVLVAFVYGVASLRSQTLAKRLVTASIVICALQFTLASPAHWRLRLSIPNAHDRTLTAILNALPRTASIATYEVAYSHLGFYPNAMEGLRGRPDFVVIDSTRPISQYFPVLTRFVHGQPGYVLRTSQDGIEVYQRS